MPLTARDQVGILRSDVLRTQLRAAGRGSPKTQVPLAVGRRNQRIALGHEHLEYGERHLAIHRRQPGESAMKIMIVVIGRRRHLTHGERRSNLSGGGARGNEEGLLKGVARVLVPIIRAGIAKICAPQPPDVASARVEVDGGIIDGLDCFENGTGSTIGAWPVLPERATIRPIPSAPFVRHLQIRRPMRREVSAEIESLFLAIHPESLYGCGSGYGGDLRGRAFARR